MGKSFENTFRSMQYLNYCTVYYDFDFDKEQIKQFNANAMEYNHTVFDNAESFFAEEKRLSSKYGFDFQKAVKEMPMRAKLKIIGIKQNSKNTAYKLKECHDAIEMCLVLFIHELTTSWGKNTDDIKLYWQKMKEYSMNYANGMTDAFVQQYFIDQIDLAITDNIKEV